MSDRVRRIAALLTLVLIAPALRAIAQAPEESKPTGGENGIQVEIRLVDGGVRSASLLLTEIPLKTDFGTIVLQTSKLKSAEMTIDSSGSMTTSAMLLDHTQFTGKPLLDSLPLQVEGKRDDIAVTRVSQILFPRPKSSSLFAAIVALLSLALMEIILGVDNIIFLSILVGKLPEEQKRRGRMFGMSAALGTRILLLFTLVWLTGMTRPLFTLPTIPFLDWPESRGVSLRDLVLLAGGLFLIGKSTYELHEKVEEAKPSASGNPAPTSAGFVSVIVQIAIIDIVFSLDSVITAVGMVDEVWVMVAGMVIAMAVMAWTAASVGRFVDNHPTIKVLALSFLILIGVMLTAEGFGKHLDKGYIYFAMAFAIVVELINLRVRHQK